MMFQRLLLFLACSLCHGFIAAPSSLSRNIHVKSKAPIHGETKFLKINDVEKFLQVSKEQIAQNNKLEKKNQRRKRGPSKRLVLLTTALGVCLVGTLISPRAVAASTLDAVSGSASAAVPAAVAAKVPAAISAAPVAAVPTAVAPPVVGTLGCHGVLSRKSELLLSFRLLYASLMGSMVGWERSASNHSAGVRTMSLVSLGAAAFTVCSAFGFWGFPRVDPSRMASNVASGVGFIGAGVITTHNLRSHSPSPKSIVHGLTTAAAIWISAAVGVASGVGLYFIAGTASIATVSILRFGRDVKETRWGRRIIKGNAVPPKRRLKSSLENDSMPHLHETHDLSTWDETETVVETTEKEVHDFFHKKEKNHTTAPIVVPVNVTDILWNEPEAGILASSSVMKKKKQANNKQDEIAKLEQLVKDLKSELANHTMGASEGRIKQRVEIIE